MRPIFAATALIAALGLAACTQPEQNRAEAEAKAAATDVTDGAKALGTDIKEDFQDVGADLKAISQDPEVKAAASDAKASLKDIGAAIKAAADKNKDGT